MTDTVPSGGRSPEEVRALADSLRSRVDLFGKGLAALATVGTGAVGLTRIGDVFPLSTWGSWVGAAAAVLGLLAAGIGAVFIATQLMQVGDAAVVDSSLDGVAEQDRANVRRVFVAAARRFGYESLPGLEERERALRQSASRASSTSEAERRTALADEVKLEVEQALARGQLAVVRGRATRAVTGGWAQASYVAILVGLVVFALGADAASSPRTDKISVAQACAEARTAGAVGPDLEDSACAATQKSTPDPEPPTAGEARHQLLASLTEASGDCQELSGGPRGTGDRPLTDADCQVIDEAIAALAGRR
ncbi:hypothetical protein G5V58_21720 [Nocardioides anomalus]|uniref:Uncharacterized protein n=1 Tax=Nocardioides anomalus TaxID=2712223 RepID=A0A6G6WIK5_9ACTN|nr:hypothetical protein [Nocardioides anomalus]QIG45036.1 hypothetical protein G5V58_21720 [Nocardioides anomalus]